MDQVSATTRQFADAQFRDVRFLMAHVMPENDLSAADLKNRAGVFVCVCV